MSSTAFIDLRINNAEQFKESITEPSPNTVLYITYGKTDSWDANDSPTVANSSIATRYEIWDNMIGAKRLFGGDLFHVIPRYNWVSGNTYTAYDHINTNLFDGSTQFYVMNEDFSVYKCISNANGSISTVEPTSVNPQISSYTSDGYIWKYMYTISDSEQIRYTTENYIPVKTLTIDDGSLQWQVQSYATPGSIDFIELTNAGSGYSNASSITITISGDGTGATAEATINSISETVDTIVITDSGTGYTYATVSIEDIYGSGASARAIISPIGGHGSDPLYELGGKNIMINTQIRYDEDGQIIADNDFRQISIIKDPYTYATSNIATYRLVNQCMMLTLSGTGNYKKDEKVYQGVSLSNSIFSGRVVTWDEANNNLYLINTIGSPRASQSLIGLESFASRVVSSIDYGDLKKYSGKILYVDNIEPIQRSLDQIEDIKIVVKF
jgi:hypothetical protein